MSGREFPCYFLSQLDELEGEAAEADDVRWVNHSLWIKLPLHYCIILSNIYRTITTRTAVI